MVSGEATRTTERHMARQAALSASDVFTGWSVPPLERAIRIDVVAGLRDGCMGQYHWLLDRERF